MKLINPYNTFGNIFLALMLVLTALSCEKESLESMESTISTNDFQEIPGQTYTFEGAIFDITSTPNGNIMLGVNNGNTRSIKVLENGEFKTMTEVSSNTNLQGIDAIGNGTAFVSSAGLDLAEFGELYKVSYGGAKMIADLAKFERENDPDAFEGIQWKNQLCEAVDGFSAGPQNNPYHVSAISGNTALVADAAGNTVLSATIDGNVDYKAILTPPLNQDGEFLTRFNAGEEGEIPCYVQPVPTSTAIGPNGFVYIGELTGALAVEDGVFPIGRSRVWKMPAGSTNVTCNEKDSSGECQVLIDGLTSVIDVEIGPDGLLYVVEFDESSWFASFIPNLASGGTITAYDLNGNLVEEVASGLEFPSAITFDKKGNLWLLEKNNVPGLQPTIRVIK